MAKRNRKTEFLTESEWDLKKHGPLFERHTPAPDRPNATKRDAHIVRWWQAGMSVKEICFATGYKPSTVERAVASSQEVSHGLQVPHP